MHYVVKVFTLIGYDLLSLEKGGGINSLVNVPGIYIIGHVKVKIIWSF